MSGTTLEARADDRWNGIEGRAWVEHQPRYDETLRELLVPFAGPTGVRLAASAWLVTARASH